MAPVAPFNCVVGGAAPAGFASVAEQDTTEVPIGNKLPDGGTTVTEMLGSTLSVAVTEKVTTDPPEVAAVTTISGGTLMTGGVVSFSVTVNAAVPLIVPFVALIVAEPGVAGAVYNPTALTFPTPLAILL